MGPLGSGPRLVGRIGSRVWASASFHNEPLDKLEALRNAFKTYLLTYLQKNPRTSEPSDYWLWIITINVLLVEGDVRTVLAALSWNEHDLELWRAERYHVVGDILPRRSADSNLQRALPSTTHVDCNTLYSVEINSKKVINIYYNRFWTSISMKQDSDTPEEDLVGWCQEG